MILIQYCIRRIGFGLPNTGRKYTWNDKQHDRLGNDERVDDILLCKAQALSEGIRDHISRDSVVSRLL